MAKEQPSTLKDIETSLLQEKRYALIGMITSDFSELEQEVGHAICELLGSATLGQIVVQNLEFMQRRDLCRRLLEFRLNDKNLLRKWSRLLKCLEELNTARNTTIHSQWHMQYDEFPPRARRLPRGRQALIVFEDYSDAYLERLDKRIMAATTGLEVLCYHTQKQGYMKYLLPLNKPE